MYIARQIAQRIESLARSFPCVVVTGARQVGKTTLLKHLFPEYSFVSLDLPSIAEQAENNPELFLSRYQEPVIVDEVQYAPKLFRYLKVRIDQDRHRMGRFILTGSQKFSLMKEVSESLAGRASIVTLETLSCAELSCSTDSNWCSVLCRGFYPELWRNRGLERSEFYASYLATYLERDLRQLLNVGSLRDFERFIRACAARSGQLLNMAELARDVGIKPHTAKEWLGVLEASNQVSLLEPYFENVGKRIVKSPKLYLNDPGLLCYLLALDEHSLPLSPSVGAVWESFVYAEFRKRLAMRSEPASLWFYRDGQSREVDFLLMHGGRLDLFECKWSEVPEDRWSTALSEVRGILRRSTIARGGENFLLCRTPALFTRGETTFLHPVEYFSEKRVS